MPKEAQLLSPTVLLLERTFNFVMSSTSSFPSFTVTYAVTSSYRQKLVHSCRQDQFVSSMVLVHMARQIKKKDHLSAPLMATGGKLIHAALYV